MEFAFVKIGFTTPLFRPLIPITIIAHLLKPMIHVTFCRILWCYQCDKIWEVMGAQNELWHSPTSIMEGKEPSWQSTCHPSQTLWRICYKCQNFPHKHKSFTFSFWCCSIEGALRLNVMVVYIMFYWEDHNEDIENPSLSSLASMLDQDCRSGSWPCPQMPHLEKFHANHPWIQQSSFFLL